MAVAQPDWRNIEYKTFEGKVGSSHYKNMVKFIDQFQGEEKFLTNYGLAHALKIRFTQASGVISEYMWSINKAVNKQRMIAEWTSINNSPKGNKTRAIDVEIVLWKGSKKSLIPITDFKKTSKFGGQLGTTLNKGTKFEKDFYADSVKVLEGVTKGNGFIKTILALDKEIGATMREAMVTVEGKNAIDSGKQAVSLSAVLEEGSANQSRPIEASNGGFVISTPGGATENIGKTVTDITYFYGVKKNPVYLSLKYGPTLTFFNTGVGSFFPSTEVIDQNITNDAGLNLLKMFDIDSLLFCKSFLDTNDPARGGKLPNMTAKNISKVKIANLLRSGIGFGYWMVHNDGRGNVDCYPMTQQYMNDSATIKGNVQIYYGRMNGNGIGVNMTCESKHYKFTFNIRNKQASGPYPTHMMCDYKKKAYPKERPGNGVA
jgi:hypothetical protein